MLERLPKTLEWIDAPAGRGSGPCLRLVDQTLLPHELSFVDCTTSRQVCDAIARLVVRGAPAIGCSGAYAVALWALCEWPEQAPDAADPTAFAQAFSQRCHHIANVRPTAVNLSWAVERMSRRGQECLSAGMGPHDVAQALLAEAHAITQEDQHNCRVIGEVGARVLHQLALELGRPLRVETHCNAGSLATAFYGTALSVVYHAHEAGDIEMVWVDETRPVDQGARLTAWELGQAGVDYFRICDNMAGSLMQAKRVDAVVVGADRVCANGDFANKIGTYPLAVLAQYHHVPFYVAAPLSTFDFSLPHGSQIVIEQRDPQEVRCAPVFGGELQPIAPTGCKVHNPAFDVTPHQLVKGFFTEEGLRCFPS